MFHDEEDPKTFKEAIERPNKDKWWTSYGPRMKSIHQHKVWKLIPHGEVPQGQKIII
jgi:hypothetical protein